VARGYFDVHDVERFHQALRDRLESRGARLDAMFFCPHHPQGSVAEYRVNCSCRKPGIGLFERARSVFELNPATSWMVGDRLSDMQFAERAGLRAIGVGQELAGEEKAESSFLLAKDLRAAVEIILGGDLG
jgi:D-glycero-D-manno-heptose 1,7-bisphosphate phosphatase